MKLERAPGHYTLDSIELYSYVTKETIELADIVGELNIYEDMFSNTMSANIIVEDTWNIIGKFPIVGHERITIIMDTPEAENEMVLEFRVYKIDNYEKTSQRAATYTIQLISAEYLLNLGQSISKSYPNSLTSDIVRSIFDDLYLLEADMNVKLVDIEPTQNVNDIWIPNWKPFDAMNWLAKRSMAENRDGANYMFYETRDGFHFRSLESLVEEESVGVYRRRPSDVLKEIPTKNSIEM